MKKKAFIIVFIIGLILILCGVGITMSGSKDTKKEKKTTNTEENTEKKPYMNVTSPDTTYYKKNSDGSMENISDKVKGVHTKDDLSVEGMKISIKSAEEPLASYSYVIKNNGSTNLNGIQVSIVFIYADGSRLNSSPSTLDIPAGGSVNVDRKDYVSIIGAADYEISYNLK